MLADIEFALWSAFWELSTERQMGMGAGPIPVSKIRSHASDFGIDVTSFVRIMRRMDDAYLSHLSRSSDQGANSRGMLSK